VRYSVGIERGKTIPRRRDTGLNPRVTRAPRTLHAIEVTTGDTACPFPRSRLLPDEDEDFEHTTLDGTRCALCEGAVEQR
jgi:hypothetical protein